MMTKGTQQPIVPAYFSIRPDLIQATEIWMQALGCLVKMTRVCIMVLNRIVRAQATGSGPSKNMPQQDSRGLPPPSK